MEWICTKYMKTFFRKGVNGKRKVLKTKNEKQKISVQMQNCIHATEIEAEFADVKTVTQQ